MCGGGGSVLTQHQSRESEFAVHNILQYYFENGKDDVVAEDIPKTAIITPFSLFEYLFTPFGLSNAAQTFQRMIDRTTDGLEGVFAYMDDSCVSSLDRETHRQHLEAFFKALAANGLAINLEKYVLQHLLLRFLATQFRRQERPPRPITPPK
jgi:hypothetical protein